MKRKLLLVGGGIGGLTTAVIAKKLDIESRIFEQALTYQERGSGISIMGNALLALKEFGLQDSFLDIGEPISQFIVKDDKDRMIFSVDFKQITKEIGLPSLCLHRGDLQKKLLHLANGVPIEMGSRISNYVVDSNKVFLETQMNRFEGNLLIGSDGIHSQIRRLLEERNSNVFSEKTPLRASGFTAWLATISFKESKFSPGTVVHYWGKGRRVGLIDIGGGRLYWWITMNHSLIPEEVKTAEDKLTFLKNDFKNWPSWVVSALEQTPMDKEIIQVETLDRKPRNVWGCGPVSLLGDAAHPSLTSLGQGAGLAIEDAVVLMQNLFKNFSVQGLRQYEKQRFRRTSKVVNLSRNVATYEQFENKLAVLMRDTAFRLMPQMMINGQNRSLLKSWR